MIAKETISALITSYKRKNTNLPFFGEFFKRLHLTPDQLDCFEYNSIPVDDGLTVELEARYRLIDRVVSSWDPRWIIELGSGFSGRGLDFSALGIEYFEIDFPEVIDIKKHVFSSLGLSTHQIPYLISSSVLDEALWNSLSEIDFQSNGVIISEGLMRYLTFPQKEFLSKKIKHLLNIKNGVWITSDVTLKSMLVSKRVMHDIGNKNHASIVLDSNLNNAFEDLSEALSYFKKQGFDIVHYKPVIDIDICREKYLHLEKKVFDDAVEFVNIFEMVPKK